MTKPKLPLDFRECPPSPSEHLVAFLPSLTMPLMSTPEVIFDDPPADAPRTAPRTSGLVTVVEWPLRPGDTRIEAYFIGTDQKRKNWYLWQFTMNDWMPFDPKYLEKKAIAKLLRQELNKRDAAVLLLKAVWEHERDHHGFPRFMLVSDCGCLDSTATYAIADMVWGH